MKWKFTMRKNEQKINKKYIKKGKRLETGRQSKGKNDRAKIK